jgi:hypothetical protein
MLPAGGLGVAETASTGKQSPATPSASRAATSAASRLARCGAFPRWIARGPAPAPDDRRLTMVGQSGKRAGAARRYQVPYSRTMSWFAGLVAVSIPVPLLNSIWSEFASGLRLSVCCMIDW